VLQQVVHELYVSLNLNQMTNSLHVISLSVEFAGFHYSTGQVSRNPPDGSRPVWMAMRHFFDGTSLGTFDFLFKVKYVNHVTAAITV